MGPPDQYSGKNSFYRETWGTRRGGCHVAKRSSDPRVAYPEVKVQVRDQVRVVASVGPLPHGGFVPGKNSFIEPQGVNWHRRPVPGAPSNGKPRDSESKFRDGTVWEL